MQNIALFDGYVAAILARLFESFPVKLGLDAREISGDMAVDDFGNVVGADGRPSRRFAIALATVEWLGEAGYIRVGDRGAFGWSAVALSPAGLELLKACPESLKVKESIGERIVRFVREGSLELAREAAKAALAAGVGKL